MSKKPFKETGLGNILWGIGDTLKGKTKTGKVLDSVLELAPIPNPIRIIRDVTAQKKLKQLQGSELAQRAAAEAGFDFNDLVDSGSPWTQPVLAGVALIGVIVLVGMGVIEPVLLIEAIKAIFAGS